MNKTGIKQLTGLKISSRFPDASTGFSLLRDKTKMQSFLFHGPLNASIIQLWLTLCLLINHWCFSGQRLGAESGFISLPWSHIHKQRYSSRHLILLMDLLVLLIQNWYIKTLHFLWLEIIKRYLGLQDNNCIIRSKTKAWLCLKRNTQHRLSETEFDLWAEIIRDISAKKRVPIVLLWTVSINNVTL